MKNAHTWVLVQALLLSVLGNAWGAGQDETNSAQKASTGSARKDPPGKSWKSLFDGKSLGKWQAITGHEFKMSGKVTVTEEKTLALGRGETATGVRWSGTFPKQDYELQLEARRTGGSDFFCGLSFPIGQGSLTLILGGWGGQVVGLSCIDDQYAIDNQTVTSIKFKQNQWYRVRLLVTKDKVDISVDGADTIYFEPRDSKLSVSAEMKPCLPLGIATWRTAGEVRNIRYRNVK